MSDDRQPGHWPPEVVAVFEQLERRRWHNLGEAQTFLAAELRHLNLAPRPEFYGLSPVEGHALVYGDWRREGPLRMDPSVPLGDLAGSRFFRAARALLGLLRDEGPIKATQAGNLPRSVVRWFLALDLIAPDLLDPIGPGTGRPNEQDLGRLHYPRLALEVSGSLTRRRGRFGIARRGRRTGACPGDSLTLDADGGIGDEAVAAGHGCQLKICEEHAQNHLYKVVYTV